MLNHDLQHGAAVARDLTLPVVPAPPASRVDHRLAPAPFLAPLLHVIGSLHHRPHQGGSRLIIRFINGYGAVMTEYRLLEGIFEIVPLRFQGPGPDDFEFFFRSHVPDLTWCSSPEEMLRVLEQISRLLDGGTA